MAKQNPSQRFDAAVTALLERRDSFVPQAGAELAPMVSLAIDLRELPRESFRTRLKNELERRTTMSTNATPARETSGEAQGSAAKVEWKRKGFRTVTPYIVVDGAAKLLDFVKATFGATERFRVPRPDGRIMHAEALIGDCIIEMADANEQYPARPMPIHVYVRDVDAAYARALAAGATSYYAPTNQEYGDYDCAVRDALGNNWYIGARKGANPIPEDVPSLMPFIHAVGTQKLIDFMKAAFGAEELQKVQAPDGTIVHAKMRFGGDAVIELSEARGVSNPLPGLLHMYVPNADEVYARAIAAGAKPLTPLGDQPYGERNSTMVDPFGNYWTVATHIKDVVF
ncbi:MAG: VOC family protein [Candidatus Acidiferrales bacterium]